VVSEFVLVSAEDHVGLITLNRPEKRNALNFEMRERLQLVLAEFAANDDVRVVVLEGAPPSFCAGVDLGDTSPHASPEAQTPVGQPFASFPKPLIAAVNGAAAGGGFEIALACDFIIASASAKFLLPEVRLGSLPGSGGTQRLPRVIPRAVAARLLYTGDALSAQTALDYGLVTEVVEPDDLNARALTIARQIAAYAPLSLVALKQCLNAAGNLPLDEGLALERGLWVQLASSDDRAEGRLAFREDRPPQFEGK
jgi:enoyl-CoA hydratase/carnithine racemase